MLNGRVVVFLSCQGTDLVHLARPVRDRLNEMGYHAVIVADEPLLRGTFDPETKVMAYIEASDAFVALCTADVRVPGGTAQNIIDEIARARTHPKLRDVVCVLKQRDVKLPSNINPTWEDLARDDPSSALDVIVRQLDAWDVVPPVDTAPVVPPTAALPSDVLANLLTGVGLGEHEEAERRLLALLSGVRKEVRGEIIRGLYDHVINADADGEEIHVGCSFLEAAARIDPVLVHAEWVATLVESEIFTHRSCAAVLLWELAETMPGAVPLDLLASLVKPATEDWYVFAPAMAAAKQVALTRKSGLVIFDALSRSAEAEDRRSAAAALADIAGVNPGVIPVEMATRLANDNDPDVAEFGRRVSEAIANVSEHARRYAFGRFAL